MEPEDSCVSEVIELSQALAENITIDAYRVYIHLYLEPLVNVLVFL